MTVEVGSLERRTPAALRAFAAAQQVEVERFPSAVDEPSVGIWLTYRRYLLRRASLEGICRFYETYDAWGDENDWCIHIEPDPAYAWLLDDAVLYTLALCAGASIDLGSVKVKNGRRVIECELTPDDSLYDTFTRSGLPIQSGGTWPDKAENEGEGPQGNKVGVYGVFCGDYGHGGRPEIHPFDAFWRQLHADGAADRISWDLGVFQDDSNRFNGGWSKAPIDVEFRIPFCLDMPVTMQTPTTRRVRFELRQSRFCSVVARNARGVAGADVSETFTAHTVRLRPNAVNRLRIDVVDSTGVGGRPFRMSIEDVTFTTSNRFGAISRQAWLAGHIVIRVAIDQDGYAYWNLHGPNSTTATTAPDDPRVVTPPGDPTEVLASQQETPTSGRGSIRLTDARPLVTLDGTPSIGAEVAYSITDGEGRVTAERVVTVRPRSTPLIVDEATGETAELESFDLHAMASPAASATASARTVADIAGPIAGLAGLERLPGMLRAGPATVEVDDAVTIEIGTRYAPFRDGEVMGEEHSRLSTTLNEADTGVAEVACDVRHTGAGGRTTRQQVSTAAGPARRPASPGPIRIERTKTGHRLTVGSLGEAPTVVRVTATATDRFGLRADASAVVPNFRVVQALPWVERATGVRLSAQRQLLTELERRSRLSPTDRVRSNAGLVRCLVDVLATLDAEPAAPAMLVAGAVRLASRVGELVPTSGGSD